MDGPSSVAVFEMGLRGCMDAFNGDARFRQLKRERHREASRMSCAEQLLRVGALALTHARPEVVWTVKRTAPKPHMAGAMSQVSTPFCLGRSGCITISN
jgi:hypothetical protein